MATDFATNPATDAVTGVVAGVTAGTTAIALPATLTLDEAGQVLRELSAALASASQPVLDASTLVTLDTAALAVLLDCQRQAATRGKTLRVVGAPPKLSQLARLYGVEGLLAF